MHVAENVRLIAPTVDVKLVEVAHKTVVRTGLGSVLRVEIDPLLLNSLELSQVVKVDATLARVAAKEEYAVLE